MLVDEARYQAARFRLLHERAQKRGAGLSVEFGANGLQFQQRRLLRALELLATGDNVTTIALELGYDNTSAFIAMFRRCLGTTPTRYLNTTN